MSPPAADGDLIRIARPVQAAPPQADLLPEDVDGSTPRAIGFAALLSLPFWVLVSFAVYLML